MKPKHQPKAVLHQPLDTLSDAQTELRWEALCDYYGIRFGAHDWRTSLLCALASDRWTGFRAAKNKRGKPRKISDGGVLLYVVGKFLERQAGARCKDLVADNDKERVLKLIAALDLELLDNGKTPSEAWLAERLCKHKQSPWKGQRTETVRSAIRKVRKNSDALAIWQPVTATEIKASLRTIAKVPGDDHPFWIAPTFEELHGDVFDDEVAD